MSTDTRCSRPVPVRQISATAAACAAIAMPIAGARRWRLAIVVPAPISAICAVSGARPPVPSNRASALRGSNGGSSSGAIALVRLDVRGANDAGPAITRSARMTSPSCAGELPSGSTPSSANRARVSLSRTTVLMSAFSLRTTSSGTPAGATNPNQLAAWKSANPGRDRLGRGPDVSMRRYTPVSRVRAESH